MEMKNIQLHYWTGFTSPIIIVMYIKLASRFTAKGIMGVMQCRHYGKVESSLYSRDSSIKLYGGRGYLWWQYLRT